MVPFQNCVRWLRSPNKAAHTNRNSCNIGPYGKNVLKIFSENARPIGTKNLWNCLAYWDQTLMEWFLGGPLWEVCPMISTANQGGRYQLTFST